MVNQLEMLYNNVIRYKSFERLLKGGMRTEKMKIPQFVDRFHPFL